MGRACMFVRKSVSVGPIFRVAKTYFCSDFTSGNANGLSLDKNQESPQLVEALLACVNDPTGTGLAKCSIKLSHGLFRQVLPRIGDSDRALAFFKWSLARPGFIHSRFTVKQMIQLLDEMHRHEEAESLFSSWKIQFCYPELMVLYTDGEAMVSLLRLMQLKPGDAALLNRCLENLCWARRFGQALMVFEEGKNLGVVPNAKTYSVLILGLCKAKTRWKHEVLELIAEVRSRGFMTDHIACMAVVAGHARVDSVDKALQLLDELVRFENFVPDTRTYNLLVDGFCEAGRMEEAWEFVERLNFANGSTFKRLVYGFLDNGHVDKASQLLLAATRKHGVLKAVTYNCVMDSLCKSSRVEELYEFWRKIEGLGFESDNYSYNIVINGLCKSGMPNEGKAVLEVMLEKGWTPDAKTYGPLIHALGKMGRLEEAKLLLDRISSSCIDVMTYTSMIGGHCKAGDLHGAYSCLREMVDRGILPNVFTCNVFLQHFANICSLRKLSKLLHEMNQEGVLPDVVSLNTVISGFLCNNREGQAGKLLKEMVHERGCEPSLYTVNIVLGWLCRRKFSEEKQVDEALVLFQVMASKGLSPNFVTYNILIGGLCERGRIEEAQVMLGAMQENGCSPTVEGYTEVIQALCRAGLLGKALKLLDDMSSNNVMPDSVSYLCIVEELCHYGKVDEAIALLQHMPCAGSEKLLCVLVKCLEKLQLRR